MFGRIHSSFFSEGRSCMTADGAGPMLTAHYRDHPTGADAWLIVDTFLHGVAGGGIRMSPDVTEALMSSLAATMSVKLSIVQPPLGGAKCGICYDPRAPDAKEVLCRVIHAFSPFLKHCWVTGSDLGTDWGTVVTACREHASIPHPQYALMCAYGGRNDTVIETGIARLQQGTSLVVDDGMNLRMSDAVTGWTVSESTIEAAAMKGESIRGMRVAIQGFGSVGGSAAKFLAEAGAHIVAVSDELGAVIAKAGSILDVHGLLKLRVPPTHKTIDRNLIRSRYDYLFAERDAVLYQPVDVLIPAAGSYIAIDIDNVRARYVVEAANDPLTEEQEGTLHRRGIVSIPDAIANAGNAGLYGLLVSGHVSISTEAILGKLSEQVRIMTRKVLEHPSEHPRRVLEALARTQIQNRISAGHAVTPNGLTEGALDALNSDSLRIRYRMISPYATLQSA
jgi:glutamate dehydrogenase (NAD(P)+)